MPTKGRFKALESESNVQKAPVMQPTLMILMMAIAIVVVMIAALVYLFISSNSEGDSSDVINADFNAPPPPGAIVADPGRSGSLSEADSGEFGDYSDYKDDEVVDEHHSSRRDSPDTSPKPRARDYNINDFNETLFIGDSIFTGIDGYGFLASENVFAQVGISASDALTVELNGRTLFGSSGIAKGFKCAVIMIGTNGLDGTNAAEVASDVYSMASDLKIAQPGIEVVILTLPPVCKENDYNLKNSTINGFNSALNTLSGGQGIKIVDFNSALRDSVGGLDTQYAQPDGVHLTHTAYEIMFSMLS